jgi:hypothetical protein
LEVSASSAVFVVGKLGKIAYAKVFPIDKAHDPDDAFAALRKL